MAERKGARRRVDIPPEILAQLNAGTLESATLAEGLAIDFTTLLDAAVPGLRGAVRPIDPSAGITVRMRQAGTMLVDHGIDLQSLRTHTSDTVRGWVAYALAALPGLSLEERLEAIRTLADDDHFGVREWAWLALRPAVAADIQESIRLLRVWPAEPSANLRRFASEVTRPRGVWCVSIPILREEPEIGLPILEPLRADPARYVQDSVANWLNDAAKSRPEWVRERTNRWLGESESPATRYIVRRATRNL
jgi:3-methyladenine DNA glycosylase AlkC